MRSRIKWSGKAFDGTLRPMRILHCLRAPVGGLFRHVLDLASAQAARGHEAGLILASGPGDALTEQKLQAISADMQLGITRIAMPRLPGPGDLAAFGSIALHVKVQRADILHGHGAKGGAYARLAGWRIRRNGGRIGVYYTPHGGTLHFSPASLEGRIYRALERRFDNLTDGIIFESAFAQRTYADRIGAGRAPQRVIHNGLRPEDFMPAVPGPGAADVVFVGELRELKGVDVLLRALAELNRTRREAVSAAIVGAGAEAEALKRLAAELGISKLVRFPGALPVREAFSLGRCLAVPSRKESFPYIVLEAAAAGLPVIATDVGGIGEIVAGTDTALIPPGHAGALAAAIASVIERPDMAQARAARLKSAVLERFTVARMCEEIAGFYCETVHAGTISS